MMEDRQKILLSNMLDDKVWCSSDCNNLECHRNAKHIVDPEKELVFLDFRQNGECPAEYFADLNVK